MKKSILLRLVCMLLVVATMSSCASVRSYEDLNDMPGVSNMYVGPGMMSMAGWVGNVLGGKVKKLTKSVTSARLIDVSNYDAVKKVRPFIKKQMKKTNSVPVFSTNKGNGEQVSIYASPVKGTTDTYSDVFVVTDFGSHMTVLVLKGNFTGTQLTELNY